MEKTRRENGVLSATLAEATQELNAAKARLTSLEASGQQHTKLLSSLAKTDETLKAISSRSAGQAPTRAKIDETLQDDVGRSTAVGDATNDNRKKKGSSVTQKNDNSYRKPHSNVSGFEIDTIKAGDGLHFPKVGQTVRVHYVGTLVNGSKFDSSRDCGLPFEFKVGSGQVIRGWDEGIVQLSKGEVAKLTLPHEYAYGVNGYPPIVPPKATLILEVELISFA